MLTWLLILFYFASSKHERVVFEYVREDIGEVAVGDIDPNLEEAEPTLEEYDGALSFPYGTNEALVGAPNPTTCSGNGIFCKCGFQDVSWEFQLLDDNQDCYTLSGVCQHCGLQDRVREIGFDYKFLPPQHEDVYRLRILKEGEIWNPPRYNYQCKESYVVTGVRSKYLRIDSLGGRDFYTLKIKCGKLKGEDDPNLKPTDWHIGKFPWLAAGEKPKCGDLKQDKCKASSECTWKAPKCENGNPFALEELIKQAKGNVGVQQALQNILQVEGMEKKTDSTKPQSWNGGGGRRKLEEEPTASIDELDLGEDFHPHLKNILSEFSKFVQTPDDEEEISVADGQKESNLDPFLVEVLEQFGDSLMEPKDQQAVAEKEDSSESEDSDVNIDDLKELLEKLDYYDLDSNEEAVSSSEDLRPVHVGDEFFNLDSDDIISGFLREESLIRQALKPHNRQNLEEIEVGDSLTDMVVEDLKEEKTEIASSLEKSYSLGFGFFAAILEFGKAGAVKYHFWEHTRNLLTGASLWELILVGLLCFVLFGLFCFVLFGMIMHLCFKKKGDVYQPDYQFLRSEEVDELEF